MADIDTPEPKAQTTLYGHEPHYQRLRAALLGGRSPHAWLLKGPQGIGKATLAYRLARDLLCHRHGAASAHDRDSRIFRMVAENAHPDLYCLEPALGHRGRRGEIKVDAIRGVLERLHQTTAFDGWRVIIIDAAEDLNRNAANALLKLLEEPPKRSVFLLTCQQIGRVPQTILSRCAQLRLSPLPDAVLAQGLSELRPEMSQDACERLIGTSGGSLGRALRYATLDWQARLEDLEAKLANPSATDVLSAHGDLMKLSDEAGFSTAVELLLAVTAKNARCMVRQSPRAARADLAHRAALWNNLQGFASKVEALNLDPAQSLLTMINAASGHNTAALETI